jgi:hypothetical protein
MSLVAPARQSLEYFKSFEYNHPDVGFNSDKRFRKPGTHGGVQFELPCRVYRLIEEGRALELRH